MADIKEWTHDSAYNCTHQAASLVLELAISRGRSESPMYQVIGKIVYIQDVYEGFSLISRENGKSKT